MLNPYEEDYLLPEDYEAAKANGINYKQAYERFYKRGWTKEDTINRPIGSSFLWPKYKELCQQNGVLPSCFYSRIKKGMTPQEAATLKPTKRQRLFKEVKITPEMIEQAKVNGINELTFKHRVYQYRWPIERAISEPVEVSKRKKTIALKGARI